jgi:putative transposase
MRGTIHSFSFSSHGWPLPLPKRWLHYDNKAETGSELAALRRSVVRGAHSGDELWQRRTVKALGLESALRPPGRPRKEKANRET